MAHIIETTQKTGRSILPALALFSALLYANTLMNSFQYDDSFSILENRYVHSLSGIGHFFVSSHLISNVPLSGYRPLTMATFALNYVVGGENPMGYHFLNVVIHVLSTLLVYMLSLALMRDFEIRRRAQAALTVALLFAVHSINTQPVNYISGRSTLLVGCFSLACFLLYIHGNQSDEDSRRYTFLLGSLATYLCALLSKEEAVALPGLLAAYEFFRIRGRIDKKKLWHIILRLLPFAILTLGFLVLVIHILGIVGDTAQPRGTWDNLMTQSKVLFLYLKLILLPTKLSIDHVVPISTSFFEPITMIAVFGVVALLVGSLFLTRSMPIVPFGIWWFFIALVPTSTLVALKLVLNEQRLYLAAVGIFCIAGASLGGALERTEAEGKHGVRQALICGFAIVLVVLSALTIRRNVQWRTPLSLWSSALKYYPDSARANTQMANIYLDSGSLDEARAAAQKAVEAAPDVVEARVAMATAYSRLDMQDEALAAARAAVDLNPDSADAQTILGLVYARLERYSEAEAAWKRAVEINPQNLAARENLERLKDMQQADNGAGTQ